MDKRLKKETSLLKLPYARDSSGKLVHINDIDKEVRGLKCNCTCPFCKSPLLLRRPVKIVDHFAHTSSAACSVSFESALHLAFKYHIANCKSINLPISLLNRESQAIEIKSCEVEKKEPLTGLIPDVTVTLANGDTIFIEVFVTNPSSEQKIELFKSHNLNLLEINVPFNEENYFPSEHEIMDVINSREYTNLLSIDVLSNLGLQIYDNDKSLMKSFYEECRKHQKENKRIHQENIEIQSRIEEKNSKLTFIQQQVMSIENDYEKAKAEREKELLKIFEDIHSSITNAREREKETLLKLSNLKGQFKIKAQQMSEKLDSLAQAQSEELQRQRAHTLESIAKESAEYQNKLLSKYADIEKEIGLKTMALQRIQQEIEEVERLRPDVTSYREIKVQHDELKKLTIKCRNTAKLLESAIRNLEPLYRKQGRTLRSEYLLLEALKEVLSKEIPSITFNNSQ